MAVYNQVLLYTFRDTLASGDPNKVIKGAYFDGEFGAIHTASLDAVSLSQNNTIAGNNSFTGTNTFNGTGITTTFAGKVVIGTPSSGTALTVNALTGTSGISVSATTTNFAIAQFAGNANTLGTSDAFIGQLGNNQAAFINRANAGLVLGVNNTTVITISAAGNASVAPPSSGISLTVTGPATNYGLYVQASTTSGQSFGEIIHAGTTSGDFAVRVQNASASADYFQVRGDGKLLGGGPVAGAVIDMTPDQSTFTGTLTGLTTSPTTTCSWVRMGNLVTIKFTSATGTSNANTFTVTGTIPSSITPTTPALIAVPVGGLEDNTVVSNTFACLVGSNVITFFLNGSSTGFTNSGTKGIFSAFQITYAVN